MQHLFDVFLTDPITIDEKIYQTWLKGLNTKQALEDRCQHETIVDDKLRVLHWRDIIDQYRIYDMLEPSFIDANALKGQILLQVQNPKMRRFLMDKYYSFDDNVIFELLLHWKFPRDCLDEYIADKTAISLRSCRRQHRNLERIYDRLQQKLFQGPIIRTIHQQFNLSTALTHRYRAVVFLAHSDIQFSAVEKSYYRLYRKSLSQKDWEYFAQVLLDHWIGTLWHPNLLVSELSRSRRSSTGSLESLRLSDTPTRPTTPGGAEKTNPREIDPRMLHRYEWSDFHELPPGSIVDNGFTIDSIMVDHLRDIREQLTVDSVKLLLFTTAVGKQLQSLHPECYETDEQSRALHSNITTLIQSLCSIGAALTPDTQLTIFFTEVFETLTQVVVSMTPTGDEQFIDTIFREIAQSLKDVSAWYLNDADSRHVYVLSWHRLVHACKEAVVYILTME